MNTEIPILTLTDPERIWMTEVYARNQQGQRFSIREIWSILYNKIPKNFRPPAMDPRLISSGGDGIRLLGIVALERDFAILDKADRVIEWIRDQLLVAPQTTQLSTLAIIKGTDLTKEDIQIILNTITDFGHFYRTTNLTPDGQSIISIEIGNEDSTYYQYISFNGIRELIVGKKYDRVYRPTDPFTFEEMHAADAKLDAILEELQKLKAGQEVIWTDIREDIEELKNLYSLGKKNWRQLLLGKIAEMVASGIVSDTASKAVEEIIKAGVSAFLPWS